MIDPDNIAFDSAASMMLPRLIAVNDYHEFNDIQHTLRSVGIHVYVTEVGFHDGQYMGLIHVDCDRHNMIVMDLVEYYKDES